MLADLPSESLRGLGHIASAWRESSRPSRHACLGRALAEVGLQQHREDTKALVVPWETVLDQIDVVCQQPGRVLFWNATLPPELELAMPRRLVRSMDVPWVVFSGDAHGRWRRLARVGLKQIPRE